MADNGEARQRRGRERKTNFILLIMERKKKKAHRVIQLQVGEE